jgi:hypothetical protein
MKISLEGQDAQLTYFAFARLPDQEPGATSRRRGEVRRSPAPPSAVGRADALGWS